MKLFTARITATILLLLTFISSSSTLFIAKSHADDGAFGIANYLPISDKNVQEGSIISFSPKGYYLSKIEYDPFAVGTVTNHPAISLEIKGNNTTYAVVATGDTPVLVTTKNGKINKGDPITTSTIPGVGEKTSKSGYIVGIALESYTASDPKAVKAILVRLNLHYYVTQSQVNVGFFDVLNLSTLATYEEPIKAFQYLVASIVVIISFIMSFFLFARTANNGIEALGRNPLASRTIQLGIVLNVAIAISIVVAGLVIAFIVLRL